MADLNKSNIETRPSIEALENSELKDSRLDMNENERENAVGYEQYLEARDIEFSNAEVRQILPFHNHDVN